MLHGAVRYSQDNVPASGGVLKLQRAKYPISNVIPHRTWPSSMDEWRKLLPPAQSDAINREPHARKTC